MEVSVSEEPMPPHCRRRMGIGEGLTATAPGVTGRLDIGS
jgi:hypothetical protein